MKKFSITSLAKVTDAQPLSVTSHESCFTGISTDSRTTRPGDCFFAITGENFDGHDYVPDAFAKGAVCAVVSKDIETARFRGKVILKVKDTIKALGDFARYYRRQCGFKVIAITGSVGKTTTRQIVSHVLSKYHRVFAAPKNFNSTIGLPLTLLGADAEDEIVVTELGSNHPGEIAYLTKIALPDVAVITNVHAAHLQGFGNLRTIMQEKLSISEGLSSEGVLIINDMVVEWLHENQLNYQLPITNHPIITFGKSACADYQAQNITYHPFASTFEIDGTKVNLPMPGQGNIENAIAAYAVCSQFGVSANDFAQTVDTLPPVTMRAEPLQIGTLTVLNDCYNANPASMENALQILAGLDPTEQRRRIFICGDMAELGEQSEQLHAELATAVVQTRVRLLLTVGKLARLTAINAKHLAEHNLQTISFNDTQMVCNKLHEFIEDHDIILVKGSRTVKLEMVVDKLRELFKVPKVPYDVRELRVSAAQKPAQSIEKQKTNDIPPFTTF